MVMDEKRQDLESNDKYGRRFSAGKPYVLCEL